MKFNMDLQFKILIVFHHLVLVSLFFIDWSLSWLLLSVLGYILFSKIGGEIGFHRYFAHRSFSTTKWKERLLLILGCFNCLGSSYGWVGTHRIHHRYSDTAKDPQSPIHYKWYNIWLVNWIPVKFSPRLVKDLLNDPWHSFIHKYYFILMVLSYSLLAIIDIRIPIFLISVTAVYTFHTSSLLIDIVCHKWGYRNFNTSDNSRNNTWVNILMLGSGLHNNHHANISSPFYKVKAYEWDLPGYIIKYGLMKK